MYLKFLKIQLKIKMSLKSKNISRYSKNIKTIKCKNI